MEIIILFIDHNESKYSYRESWKEWNLNNYLDDFSVCNINLRHL